MTDTSSPLREAARVSRLFSLSNISAPGPARAAKPKPTTCRRVSQGLYVQRSPTILLQHWSPQNLWLMAKRLQLGICKLVLLDCSPLRRWTKSFLTGVSVVSSVTTARSLVWMAEPRKRFEHQDEIAGVWSSVDVRASEPSCSNPQSYQQRQRV